MEVKAKNLGFQPITLEVTIESLEELQELYTRLNVGKSQDGTLSSHHLEKFRREMPDKTRELWLMVDTALESVDPFN